MEVYNPPSSQGEEPSLLAMVEDWSPSEVEEKTSYLLEIAKKVLSTSSGSSHESKLDTICLMADKLLGFVPIFELEDSLLCPLLEAVLEYLHEVLGMMLETEEEGRVVFFSLVCTLVEHTEKVVRHCIDQECGVGELPSLPRVLPKILISTFSFMGKGETIATTDQLKAQVANCFSKSRDLLVLFLTLMEKIKMRTVLEDELDILVNLCLELVNFHEVLIPLDFKLTCMVWRVYMKLTSTHQARLVDRLNLSLATEVISQELIVQMMSLKQLLRNTKDEGTGKVVAKVMYLMKLLISLGSTPSCLGESPFFLNLLLEMMSGMPSLPPWVPEPLRQKMENEFMSVSVMHSLLNMAATQPFISFLLNFISPDHTVRKVLTAKPLLSLQLVVQLLPQNAEEGQLLLICFDLMSSTTCSLELKQTLEGRQVMGKQVTMVDNYTWVLTNLCSWVSTIEETQFYEVENILISVLLDPASSPMTCMMVSDIWCFMARYGTSQLCMSHLALFSSILKELKMSSFSTPVMMITILMERLTNFLSPADLSTWRNREAKPELNEMQTLSSAETVLCLLSARTDKDKLARVVRDTWRRLVEGSYRPAERLASSRLVMALSEATLAVVDNFSTQDLSSLLEHIGAVARMGQFRQYLLLCLVKVVRVVARRQDLTDREQVRELVITVSKRCEAMEGESCVGVLATMAIGEVQGHLVSQTTRWVVCQGQEVEKEHVRKLLGESWTLEKGEMLVKRVNCVLEVEGEEEMLMRKVSPTPPGGLSPSLKKRKFSPKKDDVESCLNNIETEVNNLASMAMMDSMFGKKERIEEVLRRLEEVVQNI